MTRHFRTLALMAAIIGVVWGSYGMAEEVPGRAADQGAVAPPSLNEAPPAPDVPQGPATLHIPDEAINKMSADQLGYVYREFVKKPMTVPELIFQESILVPLIVFGTFGIMAFCFAYFSYRKRRDLIATVQSALQNGQALPESVLEALERKRLPRPDADLRKAVLLIALGASVCVIVWLTGEAYSSRKLAAIGVLPLLLGCAYLFLWRVDPERSRRS